ncbi:MAG TPA: MMPL family transporter [Burkholderiales bacterium]|nr:MMPL family transporter [Burkholderiales bacterium]
MTNAARARVAAWLLALGACGAWLYGHLTLTTDLSAFLPPSTTPAQRILLGQLRDGAASRLILIGLEGAPEDALARASGELARRLNASGEFAYVGNGAAGMGSREQALLFEHRYLLSPAVRAERFSVAGLEAALAETYRLLGTSAGVLVRATLPADPTGEMAQVLRQFAPDAGPETRHGVWFSRDGHRALLVAQSRAPAFDADAQRRVVQTIEKAYAAMRPATGHILLSGPGVFAANIRDTVDSDVWRLSLLGAALVLAILYAAYRSLAILAVSFLPAATGLVIGVTAVGLGFDKLQGITLGFGVTLLGEAVDYPTYLFMQARPGEALGEALARIGTTLRLAVLTTVLGALAMALSSFTGLAQLGVFTVVGVAAAGAATRWVVPAVLPVRPDLPAAGRGLPWLDRFADAARHARRPAAALVLGALAVVAWKHDRLWDDDLSSLTPVSASAKRLDRDLRAELGAPDLRYLVVARAATREAALQASEAMAAWLDDAVRRGWLAGFDVASTYLPSKRTQEARRAALPEREVLAARLDGALRDSPFRAGGFAPFLLDVARARTAPLLDMRDLEGTALAFRVESLLVRNDDGWNALATLRAVSAPAELAREASAHGTEFIDLKAESNTLVATYKNQALRYIALGLACIAALLAFALGARGAARVMAPTLAAVALDVALLLLLGKRLSLFNLVALLLVVGVGLNYALFFAGRYADSADKRRAQRAVAVCAGTTLSAFGCLALSRIPVLHEIGMTVALGASLALLLAAAFAARPA